jgi:hypothetical protein
MSKNVIIVLICHHHKPLDHISSVLPLPTTKQSKVSVNMNGKLHSIVISTQSVGKWPASRSLILSSRYWKITFLGSEVRRASKENSVTWNQCEYKLKFKNDFVLSSDKLIAQQLYKWCAIRNCPDYRCIYCNHPHIVLYKLHYFKIILIDLKQFLLSFFPCVLRNLDVIANLLISKITG